MSTLCWHQKVDMFLLLKDFRGLQIWEAIFTFFVKISKSDFFRYQFGLEVNLRVLILKIPHKLPHYGNYTPQSIQNDIQKVY